MPHSPIVPCLWLNDQAEAAAEFYVAAFRGGSVDAVAHYPESMPNPSGRPAGSVLTVDVTVAGQRFTLLNGGPAFAINPSISFFVFVPTAVEVDGLVHALVDGGNALMALDAYPWSERYAWVMDRFGVSWQVVPEALLPLLTGPDAAARDRTFAALSEMGKLDLAELRRAHDGLDLPSRRSVS